MKMFSGLMPNFSAFGARRFEFLALAEVGGEGHHLALIGILQPLEDDRGIQAARIGETAFFTIFSVGGPFPLSPKAGSSRPFNSQRPRDYRVLLSRRSIPSALLRGRRFSALVPDHAAAGRRSPLPRSTSSPRCAGRQCMNTASALAGASSRRRPASRRRRRRSRSPPRNPIDVHTSVVTRSATRRVHGIGEFRSGRCRAGRRVRLGLRSPGGVDTRTPEIEDSAACSQVLQTLFESPIQATVLP